MTEHNGAVTIRLHGALRYEVGSPNVTLPGDIGTVGAALRQLASGHGARAHDMLFDGAGEVWRSVILLVNEEPTSLGIETPVQSGDVVTVLLPLAGG